MKKVVSWIIVGVLFVATVIYFFVPVDIIPDVIALIGWLDDLVINVMSLAVITVNVLFATGVLPVKKKAYQSSNDAYGYYREV